MKEIMLLILLLSACTLNDVVNIEYNDTANVDVKIAYHNGTYLSIEDKGNKTTFTSNGNITDIEYIKNDSSVYFNKSSKEWKK